MTHDDTGQPAIMSEEARRERIDALLAEMTVEEKAHGIQKMIDEGRDCTAVLDQVASIKAAINGLSAEVAETYALHCLSHPDQFDSPDDAVRQMVRTMIRAGK